MSGRFLKDKDSLLDYKVNWEQWLKDTTNAIADNLVQVTAFVSAGDVNVTGASTLKISTHYISANGTGGVSHVIWLSAGTDGQDYALTSRITTSAGRRDDETITIRVQEE